MLYHATCIMNATWTIQTIQFTMYYGQLYYEHIISKPNNHLSVNIFKHIYINIQSITTKHVIQFQVMTTLILKTNFDIRDDHKIIHTMALSQAINWLKAGHTIMPQTGHKTVPDSVIRLSRSRPWSGHKTSHAKAIN